jgi:uncharacterized protein (TIGR00369 family)
MDKNNKYLPTYQGCMVCGQKEVNPNTLNLRFKTVDGGVEVTFTTDSRHEGYKNIVHGGITCALLDETMGWAVAVEREKYFVTVELTVRFIRPLETGKQITVRGRAVEHKSKYSIAEGEITAADGTVYARATGKFFLMNDEQASVVKDYLTFQPGDLDILSE